MLVVADKAETEFSCKPEVDSLSRFSLLFSVTRLGFRVPNDDPKGAVNGGCIKFLDASAFMIV